MNRIHLSILKSLVNPVHVYGTSLALRWPGGSPMAVPLAYITHDPEPQLPLLRDVIPVDSLTQVQREVQTNLHHEIELVLERVYNPHLREISQTIFGEMLRFFDWLARIENNLQKLDTLLESLSLLEVLEFEARSLTDFIDTRAVKLAGGNERLLDVLDGISYGITHDLRRIFERE